MLREHAIFFSLTGNKLFFHQNERQTFFFTKKEDKLFFMAIGSNNFPNYRLVHSPRSRYQEPQLPILPRVKVTKSQQNSIMWNILLYTPHTGMVYPRYPGFEFNVEGPCSSADGHTSPGMYSYIPPRLESRRMIPQPPRRLVIRDGGDCNKLNIIAEEITIDAH